MDGLLRRTRHALACMLVLACLPVLAACGSAETSGSSESSATTGESEASADVVKIGVFLPLTGPEAFFGPLFRDAIELAMAEVDNQVAGKQIELIMVDDASDLASAQTKARKMVTSDKVSLVLGPLNSAVMAGLGPYFAQNKVPMIALLNQPLELGETGWLWTPQSSLKGVAYPGGEYAAKELGIKTASMHGADYVAGREILAGFAEGFKANGGSIVNETYAPLGASDFGSFVSDLGDADAFVSWRPDTELNLLKQYIASDKRPNTLLGLGDVLAENQLREVGKDLEGTVAPLTYSWRLDNPTNKQWVEAYAERYDREPVAQIDLGGYEAIKTAIGALEATGGDTDPEKLREALRNLELDSPAGTVRFDENGFGIRTVFMLRAEKIDGKLGWNVIDEFPDVRAR
jgi:branched-chain amino acid transport system substrate-binding protein